MHSKYSQSYNYHHIHVELRASARMIDACFLLLVVSLIYRLLDNFKFLVGLFGKFSLYPGGNA